ncbi:MAG: 4'-phosphopantetheinyl transferase superfamily protein [Paraprevotella sp.]|nr:4'-phosphopantetheinyl transferase superfamily protein [Paraprevotella sp.]
MKSEHLQQVLAFLPSWRRERVLAYKQESRQMESALAYLELSRALALRGLQDIKPHFEYNEHGKPYLPLYPNLHFSISHCSQAVGCILSEMPCGLDIERVRRASPSLISKTMNQGEVKQIYSSSHPEVEFIRLWTRKEAVFKLLGTGITDDMQDILLRAEALHIHIISTVNPARGYVLSTAYQER